MRLITLSKKHDDRVQRRIEKTNTALEEWKEKGYSVTEKTVNILLVQFLSLAVCAPFCIFEYWLYTAAGGTLNHYGDDFTHMLLFTATMFFGFFIHECIHWIFMTLFTKRPKDVELGFMVEKLTPYCTCQIPMSKWQYIISLLMPTVIMGIVLACLAAATQNPYMIMFALVHTIGGGGDLTIFLMLLFYKSDKSMFVIDHPNKCGLYVLEKEKNNV
jgi:hypothetical protein